MKETLFKNGRIIVPLGTGRFGVSQTVFLVVQKNDKGEIQKAFYRVSFDGHVVETPNRSELKGLVDAVFTNNKGRRWFKFLIPALTATPYITAKPRGFNAVVADANCFQAMEPSIRSQKTPGTRIRHERHDRPGAYSPENQVAISDSGHGEYIPDTEKTRKAVKAIQDELTRAVRKAERAMDRLIRQNRGVSGDEYTGDRTA